MQEVYSKLSEEERKILELYHQRGTKYTVNTSEVKLKSQEDSEMYSNQNTSFRSEAPLKVLQTRIFNDSQPILQPQQPTVTITKKPRSVSTPKRKKTPSKKKISLNASKQIIRGKDSSRTSSSSKIKKVIRNVSTGTSKVVDFTQMANWKYEVNKLIRTVFRHSVLCPNFREESARIGGLRILDHYKKSNNT